MTLPPRRPPPDSPADRRRDAPMPRIGALLDQALSDLLPPHAPPPPRERSGSGSPSSTPPSSAYPCRCRDGVLLAAPEAATAARLITVERYGSSVLVICPDCAAGQARAARWSGLPDEARGVYMTTLRRRPDQAAAVAAVAAFAATPRGWLTLAGGYGTGKTTLIYAALNHLAAAGIYGRYTTAPALLDHLRDALRDQDGRAHSERLQRLQTVPVLAVDELDKYRATDYAEEAIFQLFDYRYRERRTLATLIGYNRDRDDRIPPFLASRIRDGRFRLVELGGVDLRPVQLDPWETGE